MISTLNDTKRAKAAFQRLFSSTDPFEPAGRTTLPIRMVLFPTDSYQLRFDQFNALMQAMTQNQERSFLMSELESDDPFDQNARWKRQHRECTNPNFDDYSSLIIGVDNALYSENGSWGVLISHELHALLVCDEQFWQVFKSRYSDSEDDFSEFIEYWQRIREEAGTDTKWLSTFVAHLTYPLARPVDM